MGIYKPTIQDSIGYTKKKKEKRKMVINYKNIVITPKEIEEMTNIFSIQSPSGKEDNMKNHIMKILNTIKGVFYKIDKKGNILVTKGELKKDQYYPCLVAHTDTVHEIKKNYKVTVTENEVIGPIFKSFYTNKLNQIVRCGGCGDDGTGIWLALDILKKVPNIKVLFTVEEEIGCIGAYNVDLSFFKDCGYLVEGDRRGLGDIIFNGSFVDDMASKEFQEMVTETGKKFEFIPTNGSFTDVSKIVERGVGISAVNLSTGYYNPHTDKEYTISKELINTRNLVLKILEVCSYSRFPHKVTSTVYNHNSYYNEFDYWYDKYNYLYDFDNDGEEEKYNNPNEICTCTEEDFYNGFISLDCPVHNNIINLNTNLFCSCGQQLEERNITYFCRICGKHKIYI